MPARGALFISIILASDEIFVGFSPEEPALIIKVFYVAAQWVFQKSWQNCTAKEYYSKTYDIKDFFFKDSKEGGKKFLF